MKMQKKSSSTGISYFSSPINLNYTKKAQKKKKSGNSLYSHFLRYFSFEFSRQNQHFASFMTQWGRCTLRISFSIWLFFMKCNDTLLSSPSFGGAVRIALDYAKIGKSGFKPFYPSARLSRVASLHFIGIHRKGVLNEEKACKMIIFDWLYSCSRS